MKRFERCSISELRPGTQRSDIPSRGVKVCKKKFRLFPRFRKPQTRESEVKLNIHGRVPTTLRKTRSLTDQLSQSAWFSTFPSQKEKVNIGHFQRILLPLASLYMWVLHLGATGMKLGFHTLFSLPFPSLMILKLYYIANRLVMPAHRRCALQKIYYCARNWAHIVTRPTTFDMYDDVFEPPPPRSQAIVGRNRPPLSRPEIRAVV